MKKIIALLAVAFVAAASAQDVPGKNGVPGPATNLTIERNTLGSGAPSNMVGGFENATPILQNDIFHAPQYLPYHPTAASIWPRVVEVDCKRAAGATNDLVCQGYNWSPAMGRAEYLFIKPRIVTPVQPIVTPPVVVPGPERIILKEVPVKKKRE